MSGNLILASSSPRRQDILRVAGIPFEAIPSSVDERLVAGESPEQYVLRLAVEKAEEVAGRVAGSSLASARDTFILGADTTVEIDGLALGKPESAEHAAGMLRLLSGRSHRVITGLCLLCPVNRTRHVEAVTTTVFFARLTDEEIRDYVDSGEPMGKAGAYAIQGLAGKFVGRIEGCYFNVMGLPVATVYRLLREAGCPVSSALRPPVR
jgi:septum formation protein